MLFSNIFSSLVQRDYFGHVPLHREGHADHEPIENYTVFTDHGHKRKTIILSSYKIVCHSFGDEYNTSRGVDIRTYNNN